MAAAAPPPRFDGPTINNPHAPPDFALRDQQQRLVRLSALRGKVVGHVPLHALQGRLPAHRRTAEQFALPDWREALAGAYPRRQRRPKRRHASLRRPLHPHSPAAAARSATSPAARRLDTKRHASSIRSTVRAGAGIDHTLYTLLLDRNGRGRVLYDSTARSASVAHDLRLLSRPLEKTQPLLNCS